MTKVAQNLKPFYSNLVHVTCVAHGIHRISGKIIDTYHDNNNTNNGKMVFSKAPYKIKLYKEMMPNTHLTPQPIIITLWGTWPELSIFMKVILKN